MCIYPHIVTGLDIMNDLEQAVDNGEKIGVIGSPSRTSRLSLDILGTAVEKRLVGTISVFKYRQNDSVNFALGQITEVTLSNQFAQDPIMRGLIRQRGSVEPITKQQDIHMAEMMVSAVFEESNKGLEQSSLDTIPSTGTPIKLINQDIMSQIVAPYEKDLSIVGKVFGNEVLMPSWFRHFGRASEGGIGDAMHLGIFGKTGSGKSVLGKMILLSYMKHKPMSILILDPQGEFSKMALDEDVSKFVKEYCGKEIEVYDLSRLLLVSKHDLFKKILVSSNFLRKLGIKHLDNQMDGAEQILRILLHKYGHAVSSSITGEVKIWKAYSREVFDHVWERIQHVASGRGPNPAHPVIDHIYTATDTRNRILNTMDSANEDEFYELWRNVLHLFGRENKYEVTRLDKVLETIGNKKNGKIVIVNLSDNGVPDELFWNERSQSIAINHILENLVDIAKMKYNQGGDLNTLVVLDEAHRFAPRRIEVDDEEIEELRHTLRDAVRTTRKYKLGWMFISQTLASLDKEIINQLRMYFFGHGLAWGTELEALRQLIGGNSSAQKLYQQFKDPESSIGEKKYSFMGIGPSSPLSFSQVPLFFNSLDFPKEYLSNNKTE